MGKFRFIPTGIADMYLIEPTLFGDARGYFMETYNYQEFAAAGLDMTFVQDNQSKSKRGVLRGLHFQTRNSQGKLVRVIRGEVFDVGVDLREGSATFGKWYGTTLSAENHRQLYIPEGFAHGFLVTSEEAEFVYKCTRFYDPSGEGGLLWNDPDIGIDWPVTDDMDILLSDKDKVQPTFREYLKQRQS